MFYLLILLGMAVGALLPWQPVINSRLGYELNSSLWAAFISFLGGALLLGLLLVLKGQLLDKLQKLPTIPLWMMSGGVLGVMFVGASIFLVPKIGATSLTASFVCGQLAMSLIMDHYALAGLSQRTIDLSRLIGVLLLLIGLFLIVKPQNAA